MSYRPLTRIVREIRLGYVADISSRPLTGMVRIPLNSSRTLTRSRPLAGISCNALTPIASPRLLGFRPLTGMVPSNS